MKPATRTQIRAHYIAAGYHVRISMAGHVEFKPDPDTHPLRSGGAPNEPWLDGRWVKEYWCADDGRLVMR